LYSERVYRRIKNPQTEICGFFMFLVYYDYEVVGDLVYGITGRVFYCN